MAALSTLELMLHDIQNQQNNLGHHETMPTLPQRPLSKARIPTRRAVLSFHFQEVVDGNSNLSKKKMEDGEEENGIIGIQRCLRGYLARFHYHNLKEGAITLQSFVRGENARRAATEAAINKELVWQAFKDRETKIIYLQSAVRGWLSRRRHGYIQKGTTMKEEIKSEEDVMVSTSYIAIGELERRVLRSEAALREKKQENRMLELQIQEIDRKWELHKDKMNLKEDEFTSIQMSLAGERMVPDVTIRDILESDIDINILQYELKKLKGRFKRWKKVLKRRLDDSRIHKTCWLA